MTRIRLLSILFLIALITPLAPSADAQNPKQQGPRTFAGRWDAVITNASKIDVPFQLSIMQEGSSNSRYFAVIINGSERLPFTSSAIDGGQLNMRLEQYDGTLSVRLEGDELRGGWVRQTAKGVMHYPVRASRRQEVQGTASSWKGDGLAGEWMFAFEGDTTPDRIAPAEFKQSAAKATQEGVIAEVQGTIAPVSGDYGLLAGRIRQSEGKAASFELSRFDGIHIVLVTGEVLADGSLRGKLNNQAFTAVRKQVAAKAESEVIEPDPESVTTMKDPSEVFRFTATDLKMGKPVTQEAFKGKPYIVDIFGTWCPNCHDEAPLLTDLYNRYHDQGLEIVGLAYEYVEDPARNSRLLEVYRKKYGINFPLLLAGTTDEGQIAKTLPQLVGFGAYPTTIFIGPDGKVKKIHAGFAGPATGERFTETKKRFEENVKVLIAK